MSSENHLKHSQEFGKTPEIEARNLLNENVSVKNSDSNPRKSLFQSIPVLQFSKNNYTYILRNRIWPAFQSFTNENILGLSSIILGKHAYRKIAVG